MWSLSAGVLGQIAFYLATGMITGIAFGALLLSSAPAIVLYFALPIALSALGQISALSSVEWARVSTTLALWMLLPLLIGLYRITRGEVR